MQIPTSGAEPEDDELLLQPEVEPLEPLDDEELLQPEVDPLDDELLLQPEVEPLDDEEVVEPLLEDDEDVPKQPSPPHGTPLMPTSPPFTRATHTSPGLHLSSTLHASPSPASWLCC